ncbi:uncharacterized protein CTRU02_214125 [Colletotrichum truncatum]|uniref:Uncharacterized protein n=1 Tax=Colletotrichum truncatum TaxID=5467 RepID=A0ACC3YHK3_COLTU|nr:uncharacterized protein CTRU02_06436 [Colletotrichum truncatum]KAF6792940.1 hypothetical protein CTRU02_06436 [Colletotrichum truncatum]
MATISRVPAPAKTTEAIEAWILSSPTDASLVFKGILLGVLTGLLLASLACCWIPCLHYFYTHGNNGGIHDFHMPRVDLHMPIQLRGGFRPFVRRRIRLFFMGREESTIGGRSDDGEAAPDISSVAGQEQNANQERQVGPQHHNQQQEQTRTQEWRGAYLTSRTMAASTRGAEIQPTQQQSDSFEPHGELDEQRPSQTYNPNNPSRQQIIPDSNEDERRQQAHLPDVHRLNMAV